ncbi:spermidine synthase [Alicyclobacillus kakegawensis]|uniref:spermidine synthase n=1 Tax=Alicyclobacillus kakegawensis TaxID=392012 RepID=UPI00082ECB8C|nr:hypothetical protein [Alicyclobacillus kakegawensis]
MNGIVELERRGQVHDIQVIRRGRIRYLRFGRGGGWQGALDIARPWRPVFPYQRAFYALAAAVKAPRRFLAVGVGTGTALRSVRRLWPECRQVGVELDETVVDVALEYFDSPPTDETRYYVGDGVRFLETSSEVYDLIFVDAYLRNRIYSPCLQPSFAHLLHVHLSEAGVVAFNIIMSVPPAREAARFLRALTDSFAEVLVLPVGFPGMEQNCLVVASRRVGLRALWRAEIRRLPLMGWHERLAWPWRIRTMAGLSVL